MNRTLQLPDAVYAALRQTVEASGMSPADWIAARTGVVGSGGRERLSEETGEKFADHLKSKRRAGRL